MEKITQEELDEIIYLHRKWLDDNKRGIKAYLSGVDLRGLNLKGADLRCSDFEGSDLSHANLECSDMSFANLTGANLTGANLRESDLYGVQNINTVITNEETKFLNNQCPKEGEFIGWKKCYNIPSSNSGFMIGRNACAYIVKLLIPSDSKRSSATTYKCRCSKATVLAIYDMNGKEITDKDFKVVSKYDTTFKYKIGQTVVSDSFDEDWWNECSSGIHFFMDRKLAEEY